MRIRTVILPLLTLGATIPCTAQGGGNDVPRELAQALLFPLALRGQPEPGIVVGRLPDEISADLLPPAATVVGGMADFRGGSAILTVPQAPPEAIAGWRAQLGDAGWRPLDDPSAGPGPGMPAFALCGPDRTVLVGSATPRTQGGSELYVRVIRGDAPYGFCSGEPRPAPGQLPVPTLRPPEGTESMSHGTSSSPDRFDTDGRVRTTRSPVEVAADFVAQFRQAGWSAADPRADAGGATASAELRDARGKTWRALVAVLPVADSERFYVVRIVGATGLPREALALEPVPVTHAAGLPVPGELVRALLAEPGDSGRMMRPTLVAERLPPELAGMPLPPGARVIGGAVFPDQVKGVVFVPGEPRLTFSTYGQRLRAAGWYAAHPRALVGHDADDTMAEYCDANGRVVFVAITPVRDGGSYLTFQSYAAGGSCRPETRAALAAIPLPVLRAPEGAELRLGGGFGGSPFEGETDGRLETALSPAAVVEHYAGLLRQAGWTVAPPTADARSATATGELRDAQGNSWHGVIAVIALSPTERDVTVRVVRPQP